MPGDFCGDSFAQSGVEIILITDQVETEVKKLYRKIISLQSDGTSGTSGQQYREILLLYANLRTELDQVLRKLSLVGDGETREEKRIIRAGLSLVSRRLARAGQLCSESCRSAGCRSCGLTVIQAVRDVLETFNKIVNRQGAAPYIKQQQRTGLLNIVGLYNKLSRKIFNILNIKNRFIIN